MSFYKNILVTVSDKTGLIDALRPLAEAGARIVSTGGTAKVLMDAGIKVTMVSEQTQFEEVMEGRVKTLHPSVFMPVLARKGNAQDEQELKKKNLDHFDLVICNLYPFEEQAVKSKNDFMKWVDVGGPSLLRASAKNFEKVTVIYDPADYHLLASKTPPSIEVRKSLASKVFTRLSQYDSTIAQFLEKDLTKTARLFSKKEDASAPIFSMTGSFFKQLRYGENPDQKASWFRFPFESGMHEAQILSGKPLSYNNLIDLEAAVSTLREFQDDICCVGVKHTNPCGVAIGKTLSESVKRALAADPVSIFGGIVAVNRNIDLETAELFKSLFFECLIAPSYDKQALELLSQKKNLRILSWDGLMKGKKGELEIQTLDGGFLVQEKDNISLDWSQCQIDGESPSAEIKKDMEMAWKVCAHLKSNAIALVSEGQTLGLGMGQVNRVHCVELAIRRMKDYHKDHAKKQITLASDGFFPFSDSLKIAGAEGVRWVIQPGGSIKDKEVIKEASAQGINMVRTGARHFKH